MDDTYIASGKLKRPSVSLILEWIINAWKSITCDTVIKGSRNKVNKLDETILNKQDGTVDCALWDDNT